MKIRVIDLLNMISKGEELPKKIKYNDKIYYMVGNNDYENYEYDEEPTLMYAIGNTHNMNDEVEIIEEKKEDKKIEKMIKLNNISNPSDMTALCTMQWENNKIIEKKINEIIDKLNKEE